MATSQRAIGPIRPIGQSVAQATDGARRAAASSWVTVLARLGYTTRGFLYVVIGLAGYSL